MRISRNSNPYGGNQPSTTTSRGAIFKRKVKVGQLLKGRMLRVEQEGLAWVLIGDMELLAQVETMPEPGQWMEFLILSLEPSILLRQLQHGTDPRGSFFLRDYIRSYLTERDKLDTLLSNSLWNALTTPENEPIATYRSALINFLTCTSAALDQFTRVMRLHSSVQQMITASGHGTFQYIPWLMPSGRGVELLISKPENNICTVTAGIILHGAQHVLTTGQMNLSTNPVSFAYRLLLDKNCKAGNNTSRATSTSSNCTCLGTSELPAGAHDILSLIFKEIPAQRRGLDLRA
ncbi:hypothetical protein [Halodesulfovibrio marinisediminis]|uniref:Uncharacterized protein n=1 Tax=Halodesulfovibrio marinisediminis DSM 17456 TaxID=1121457 RepID=A0A1N6J1V1_9BACT|nr:hypothetical protein [Halodesulfovibrio marinisediminis]SIO38215.1 hypothetical protein SAMN02745161_3073 [Halodesulfovibrio marinisediminis DSM 17456]